MYVHFYNFGLFSKSEKRTFRWKRVKLRVRVGILDYPISFSERRRYVCNTVCIYDSIRGHNYINKKVLLYTCQTHKKSKFWRLFFIQVSRVFCWSRDRNWNIDLTTQKEILLSLIISFSFEYLLLFHLQKYGCHVGIS